MIKIAYIYCVTNKFDQLLRFKTWETRLFKMPRFGTPHFQTGMRVTVASGPRNSFVVPWKSATELEKFLGNATKWHQNY